MAPLKEYDPGEVALTIGVFIITGFAPGTFITVAREAQTYTKTAGADGEVARTKSRNRSGSVTFVLMGTSPSNADLAAILIADENAGTGVTDLMIKDNSGNDLHIAAESWGQKPPNAPYGDELSNREYVWDCADITMISAGSGPVADFDLVPPPV